MEKLTNEELIAMLVVLYKKIDVLERKVNDKSSRMYEDSSYLAELRQLAERINL